MNPWKYKNAIKMQDNVWLRLIVFTDISLHYYAAVNIHSSMEQVCILRSKSRIALSRSYKLQQII